MGSLQRTRTAPKNLKPFDSQDIKILLLENVNQSGKDILSAQGYQVESLKSSLPEDQLIEKIRYRLFFLAYYHSIYYPSINKNLCECVLMTE